MLAAMCAAVWHKDQSAFRPRGQNLQPTLQSLGASYHLLMIFAINSHE